MFRKAMSGKRRKQGFWMIILSEPARKVSGETVAGLMIGRTGFRIMRGAAPGVGGGEGAYRTGKD